MEKLWVAHNRSSRRKPGFIFLRLPCVRARPRNGQVKTCAHSRAGGGASGGRECDGAFKMDPDFRQGDGSSSPHAQTVTLKIAGCDHSRSTLTPRQAFRPIPSHYPHLSDKSSARRMNSDFAPTRRRRISAPNADAEREVRPVAGSFPANKAIRSSGPGQSSCE